MKQIIPHLDKTMQDIYRKAVDADKSITELKKKGMAKFTSIFEQQNQFDTKANSFMPYVSELAGDIEQFKHASDDQTQLAKIMKKMEMLLKTLNDFSKAVK